MEPSTIGVIASPASAPRTTTRGFADMRSEDFFGLLIAELRNQDPLNPKDNQQLLQEMATIRQMEQSTVLNHTLTSLAGEQRFGSTAGLIGHYVAGTITNEAGAAIEVRGVVIGVQFSSDGSAVLELHNGRLLPARNVTQVTLVENLPPEILAELGLGGGEDGNAGDGGDGGDGGAGAGGSGSKGGGTPPPARLIRPGLAATDRKLERLGVHLGRQADQTVALIESLVNEGIAIGL